LNMAAAKRGGTVSDLARNLAVAEKMILLGARPSIVSSMCGIHIRDARDYYEEIHGGRSPSGMQPFDSYWILRSAHNCIHASIFHGFYERMRREHAGHREAEIFVAAYKVYHGTVNNTADPIPADRRKGQERLDINRAYYIVRQYRNKETVFENCPRCKSYYLVIANYPAAFRQCPLCEVWVDRTGRSRWRTVDIDYGEK